MKPVTPSISSRHDSSSSRTTLEVTAPERVELQVEADSGTQAEAAGNLIEQAEQMLRQGAPHDFEVLVIGGGAGGCAAAITAARAGLRVGLVTRGEIGGRALQHALLQESWRHAISDKSCHWKTIQSYAQQLSDSYRAALRHELDAHQITIISGEARFIDDHTIQLRDCQRILKAVHLIIATGTNWPPQPTISHWPDLPKSCLVRGADGLELAGLLQQSGVRVFWEPIQPQLSAPLFQHTDLRHALFDLVRETGITIMDGKKVTAAAERTITIHRTADIGITKNTNLEKMLCRNNIIAVDENLMTTISGVYAVGGCAQPEISVSGAVRQGVQIGQNIGQGEMATTVEGEADFTVTKADADFIPLCRTCPEVAFVGLPAAEVIVEKLSIAQYQETAQQEKSRGLIGLWFNANSQQLSGGVAMGAGAYQAGIFLATAYEAQLTRSELADGFAVYGAPQRAGQSLCAASFFALSVALQQALREASVSHL